MKLCVGIEGTGKLLDSAYMKNYKSWVQNVCAIYKGSKFCLCLCLIVKLSMISHPLSSLLNPVGYYLILLVKIYTQNEF
jgi:hypothetical protein